MNNNDTVKIKNEAPEVDGNPQRELKEADDELTTAEIHILLGHATAKDRELLDRDWSKPGDREWLRTIIPEIERLQREWPYIREDGWGKEWYRRKLPTMWQGFGYYVYETPESRKYMDEYMETTPLGPKVAPDFRERDQTEVPPVPAGL